MDGRVRSRIVELTKTGVRRLPEMKRHLHSFVEGDLFHGHSAPAPSDARFWPSSRSILNCMYRTSTTLRFGWMS